MSTPSTLTTTDILPQHEKNIRDALKKILRNEPLLKEIRGWHNTLSATGKTRPRPYGYIMFISRNPIEKGHDIYSFYYSYTFQIGLLVELKTTEEDHLDDKALELMNLVESVLTKNRRILDTVERYHHSAIKRNDPTIGFMPNHRHLSLTIQYTDYVQYDV